MTSADNEETASPRHFSRSKRRASDQASTPDDPTTWDDHDADGWDDEALDDEDWEDELRPWPTWVKLAVPFVGVLGATMVALLIAAPGRDALQNNQSADRPSERVESDSSSTSSATAADLSSSTTTSSTGETDSSRAPGSTSEDSSTSIDTSTTTAAPPTSDTRPGRRRGQTTTTTVYPNQNCALGIPVDLLCP